MVGEHGAQLLVDAEATRALEGEDAEAIKTQTNELTQATMKLGEAMYKAQQAAADAGASASAGEAPKDDVIDADFKEVNKDDKKGA